MEKPPERKRKKMVSESMMCGSSNSNPPSKKRRRMSAESRAKISAAKKGQKKSPETRAKMSAAKKGHVVNEATRRKMSRSHRATFRNKTGFTRAQADAIRAEYAARLTKNNPNGQKVTYKSLAEKYHVSVAYVYGIIKGKLWMAFKPKMEEETFVGPMPAVAE